MLFVDDSECEVMKMDVLLEKSVCTDDDIDLSVSEFSFYLFFLSRSSGSREKFDTKSEREEEFG